MWTIPMSCLAAVVSLFLAAPGARAKERAGDAAVQGLRTPAKGSAERKAILDALRAEMNAPDLVFVVQALRVRNGWAWAEVRPQSRDGKRRLEGFSALLRAEGEGWKVECLSCLGSVSHLRRRFPAIPPDIFGALSASKGAVKRMGEEVLRVSYGPGDAELGIEYYEAGAIGPMSFALAPNGEIYILDQVNSRIQVFSGKSRVRGIPIPARYPDPANRVLGPDFQDIALTKDGRIVLLDNMRTKSVYLLDAAGSVIEKLPLAGKHVPPTRRGEQANVSGVYWRDDGIWVESGDLSIRLADHAGRPDPVHALVKGKLTRDGKRLMKVERIGEITAALRTSPRRPTDWTTIPVYFDEALEGVYQPYDDSAGNILFAVSLGEGPKSKRVMIITNAAGKEKKRITVDTEDEPKPTWPPETWRDLRVSADGRIFELVPDDEGVSIWRYDP